MRNINIFSERELRDYLDNKINEMKAAIQKESADYLLNVNEDDYVRHLLERYEIDQINICFDQVDVSAREAEIPAERFPRYEFHVAPGKRYPKQVITYHIPYSGDEVLLRCRPSRRIMWTHEVWLEKGCICFDIIDFYNDGERIKRDAEDVMDGIRKQSVNVQAEVDLVNKGMDESIRRLIVERRSQVQKQNNVVLSLGVPVRKSSNVPETFRIPAVRKKITPRPIAQITTCKPEPTLGDDIYQNILQVIHETGKVFERLPNTYAGKGEEDLRDHLILQLEPQFEYSTTGETFNRSGKTDILVRDEKSNIFVAECKYWSGEKKHLECIDQLLGYLTWRDSKTAIVYFVDRKDFSNVIKIINEKTKSHSCYLKYVDSRDETWMNYIFHLPGDPDRKVKVAILAFHLPK
jgi:hypothetical protein